VLVKAVGVFAIAAICGAAAGLNVGDTVGLRAEDPPLCFRTHGPGTDFDVVRLLDDAAAVGPVALKFEDGLLEVVSHQLSVVSLKSL